VIYEYRLYIAAPGRMPELNARFRDDTMRIFKKHGMKVVGFWTPMIGSMHELHYILAWDSLEAMEKAWKSMRADEEWIAVRKRTEANGPIVTDVRNQIWNATDYSPTPNAV
jgi:molybdopterin-guanine dinucleotide biosynthesis protein A